MYLNKSKEKTNNTHYFEEKVYILLPVSNRKALTQKFIECLVEQTYRKFHLVLIDDGSSDGTKEMVERYIKSLTTITGKGNWWWAGALQQGYLWLKSLKASPNNFVLIINDDTQFENDFLETGVNILKNSHNSMLLAQCYSNITHELVDSGVNVDWRKFTFNQAKKEEDINCLSSNGLLLNYNDFLETKGFYPNLLPHYASDYEFTMRAIRSGIKPKISTEFKIYLNEKTTGYHDISNNYDQIKTFKKYLSRYFSLKSPSNPLYLTSFILLSCPWQWKIYNIIRIWKRSFTTLVKHFWARLDF